MDAHAARKRASAEGRVQNARSTLGCGRAGMNLEALVGRLHRAAHCDREDLPAKMDMTQHARSRRNGRTPQRPAMELQRTLKGYRRRPAGVPVRTVSESTLSTPVIRATTGSSRAPLRVPLE